MGGLCCCADAESIRVFILDWRCFGISKVQHQLNEEINDKEIRLIGEGGEQMGIVSGEEALRIAEEHGLDLVKISPQATPPVCKLMNYGKYKFEQSKREKEARKNQHVVEIKEIRMSPGIDVGDFNTKLKNAQKFLSDGNRVKVSVRFRGREMAHTDIGRDLLNKFADLCTEVATLDKAAKLEGRSTIRVKFLKDDMTQSGDFSIIKIDGNKYGKIDFSRGLIRYASDRFLDIELVTNTVTGLKIPLSAIESKDFYVIPAEYATTDPDSGSVGFNKISKDSSGNNVRTFINATIYGKVKIESDDDSADEAYNYYVDRSAFKEGDAIVKDDSNQRFIVGETDSLEGVYCINQGYAVFRQVDILDQNEEYAIISSNTSYGLSRYDRIARDSSQVKEQDILY
jgi:translation initiation factor IF-3